VVLKRALFGWAVWLAMLPLVLGVVAPKRAEAALPLVIIAGVAYTLDTPIVLAVLAASVAVLGEVYCVTDAECAEFVQGVVDAAPAWLIAGITEAVNNGLGTFNVTLFGGYDEVEMLDAFEAAALPAAFTQRSVSSSVMSTAMPGVPLDPINIVRVPSATYGTGGATGVLWESPIIYVPATAVDATSGATFTVTGYDRAFPSGGTAAGWASGSLLCGTTTATTYPAYNCSSSDMVTASGGTTWPTGSTLTNFPRVAGAPMRIGMFGDGAGGTFTFEVPDVWYRWSESSGATKRSNWVRVPVLAGTFTAAAGAAGMGYSGTVAAVPAGAVAIPADYTQLVGVVATPDTQVTTVRGGTVPIAGGADVGAGLVTGIAGLAGVMLRVATAVETVATWVSDFPAQLGAALTTALDDALGAAFVPETTAEARVTALADVVATKAPVSYVVKVQDAWEDATAYGADCPTVSVPYAPWAQTGFELCLPSGVSTWTRAFSQFVAAAGVALWAWGFYRRLVE